jgi:hypothetical protein
MGPAALQERLRQQVAAVLLKNPLDGDGVQHPGVDGVFARPAQLQVDPTAELLQARTPVHVPLMEPHRIQGSGGPLDADLGVLPLRDQHCAVRDVRRRSSARAG